MTTAIAAVSLAVIAGFLVILAGLRRRRGRAQKIDPKAALRLALEMSREPLLACRDGAIISVNEAALRLLDLSLDQAKGQPFLRFIHPDYQMLCEEDCAALLGEPQATPAKLVSAGGRTLDIQLAAWRSTADQRDILVSLRDISELMRANHNVAAQLKRLNSILDTAQDAIIVSDQGGRVETFNAAAERLFGIGSREMLGKPFNSLFTEQVGGRVVASASVMAKRKDGSLFPAEMSLSVCQLDDRVLSTALIRDVTERRNFENHLAHAASHDALTGLPNRNLILDRLHEAIGSALHGEHIVAVWFFDLNGIKTVNDVMGHAAGDQLLIDVGQRMIEIIGTAGLVARFGGDEFAVIAGGFQSESEVGPAVEDFLHHLSQPFMLMGREVTVTANAGIALYPKHSRTPSELLLDASAAMMFSKNVGRNQFRFFDPIMHRQSEERLTLETELRRGIERDELLLHYQPQVEIATGRIVGLEALVRWQHPIRGLVPPGLFIPIAEQTGLIEPLGEWVLKRACRDLRRMELMGISGVRVGVNISPRQFVDRDIVGMIQSVVADSGITPQHLDVEITESTLMSDPEGVMAHLEQIRNLGIHVSLDDFGTGFSSLNYLKRFPADTLKVDRSFVIDLANDSKDEAIAMSIITLAHSLGLTALAEGVEHVSQYEVLRFFECDVVQGYLFSPPMPYDEVIGHLQRGTILLPQSTPKATRKAMPQTTD